jgi:hypothetical protein
MKRRGGSASPRPTDYFAAVLVRDDGAKSRWGVGKIIFPTFLSGRGQ